MKSDAILFVEGSVLNANLDILSRDCFPDVTNPGIEEVDVTNGCRDAADFEDVFSNNVKSLQGLNVTLNDVSGSMCFCDDDACNDCIEDDVQECYGTSIRSLSSVHFTSIQNKEIEVVSNECKIGIQP